MLRYFVKRILSTIPVLLIISVIVFSMIHLTPGDPAQSMLGPEASEEQIESLRKAMGLYDPLPVQYVNWIADILHGDFGTSVANNEPVLSAIRSHMGPTISVTDFLIGLFLMLLFAVKLKWLPSSGYVPLSNGLIAHLRSITLPSIALGFTYSALMMRMTKAAVYDALHSDYIKFAKAKGVHTAPLLLVHSMKNASVKLLTIVGQAIIGMLSGAAVIETIFMIPGVGQLIVLSISRRDYGVIQAVVLLVALMNVVIMLLVDLMYGMIDPRIKME